MSFVLLLLSESIVISEPSQIDRDKPVSPPARARNDVFIESLNAAIYAIFRQLTPRFQWSHAESRASEPGFVLLAAAVRIISKDLKVVGLPSKLARNDVFLILKSPAH